MRYAIALVLPVTVLAAVAPISFNRDIQPILSNNCYKCHGPDNAARKAKLRLDREKDSKAELKSGGHAIVSGNLTESELIYRITTKDDDERMPPSDSHRQLTPKQIELLKQWVKEGGKYEQHWSFIPPKTTLSPAVKQKNWPRNNIDHFILARLESEGLKPSPEADKPTLLRRVSFDLTGLPPSLKELNAFLADSSPDAFEKAVDRLLASPRYGEHMTRYWLDVARYADTNGYQYDTHRSMWPWRDWVIRAYNRNLPFDQFTVEQLAGDLLPNATLQQKVATGFNRNHPITIEGGVIDEEYRVEYVMDRVVTTTQTWLAMSVGCARCHDHKYDPVSQDEFYQIFSFFNSVADRGMSGFAPQLSVQSPEVLKQVADLDAKLKRMRAEAEPSAADLTAWEQALANIKADWSPHPPSRARAISIVPKGGVLTALNIKPVPNTVSAQITPVDTQTVAGRFVRVSLPGKAQYLGLAEVQVFSSGQNIAKGKKAKQSTTGYGGTASRAVDGNTNGVYGAGSITHTNQQNDPWWEVDLGKSTVINKLAIWNRTDCCTERLENFTIEVLDDKRAAVWKKTGQSAPKVTSMFDVGGPIVVTLKRYRDLWIPANRVVVPPNHTLDVTVTGEGDAPYAISTSNADTWLEAAVLPADIKGILMTRGQRTVAQTAKLMSYLRDKSPSRRTLRDAITNVEQTKSRLSSQPAAMTLVMQDLAKPRKTYFLERGQYDQRRHELQPDVPAILGDMDKNLPRNRLGFAKWLVDPKHPLTARVAINRHWQRLFGAGIVKSGEEFGVQGDWPSHPALLDWLAVHFTGSGWNTKALLKLIVTSATYRQSSRTTPALLSRDPENRLLTRGPRHRLDAEVIRDTALAVSGLLVERIGGPSVYPYHPKGLWMELNNRPNYSRAYKQDTGDKLYRRSLYTYWKRTVPPPSMATFDAPEREFCLVRRSRTNTPLQAFVMLHDPQFIEAARHLAKHMMGASKKREDQLEHGFRLTTSRLPNEREKSVLKGLFKERLAFYNNEPKAAKALLSVGESRRQENLPEVEHAAWITVARALLNLSETITKN